MDGLAIGAVSYSIGWTVDRLAGNETPDAVARNATDLNAASKYLQWSERTAPVMDAANARAKHVLGEQDVERPRAMVRSAYPNIKLGPRAMNMPRLSQRASSTISDRMESLAASILGD